MSITNLIALVFIMLVLVSCVVGLGYAAYLFSNTQHMILCMVAGIGAAASLFILLFQLDAAAARIKSS